MIRLPLLLTLTLFLTACSETATDNQTNKTTNKEPVAKQIDNTTEVQTVTVAPTKEKPPIQQQVEKVSGRSIYVHKCASCHGQKGEKIALNKSQIITGWKQEKSITALNGYKDGSYGGTLKAIMKGQVTALSSEQIEALAEYIATL